MSRAEEIEKAAQVALATLKPFSSKPIGGEGSAARRQQLDQIEAWNALHDALAIPPDAGAGLETSEQDRQYLREYLYGDDKFGAAAHELADAIFRDFDKLLALRTPQGEREPGGGDPLLSTTRASGVLREISFERVRQHSAEGWDEAHDDKHTNGELARAAACYCAVAGNDDGTRNARLGLDGRSPWMPATWPWEWSWWKPTNRRRDLVKAAALIVAEIERLDRAGEHLKEKG
jgi:hypothetical protein